MRPRTLKAGVVKVLTALVLVLLAAGASAVAILWFQDYGPKFTARKGTLVDARVQDAGGDSAFTKSWLTLRSNTGLQVECGMLVPLDRGRRHPAVILLGGKATGKHAVDYVLDIEKVIVVAVDYPYEQRASYKVLELLGDVPAMRRALLDMVPSVMLVTDYLAGRSDVDTARVMLVGYSFGAPLVPAIAALDRRAAAAVMVYGAGDLHSLIRHNVRRYVGPVLSEFVAGLAALLLRPLEPLRYAGRITPVPLLMLNGSEDEKVPRKNVELLYEAAAEPKKIVWLESRHVYPGDVELTRRIIRTLTGELKAMGLL